MTGMKTMKTNKRQRNLQTWKDQMSNRLAGESKIDYYNAGIDKVFTE
jgi:hypothetical protein